METKIAEIVEYSLDANDTKLKNKLWFVDGFAEQGDENCALIITEENDLMKDWKGIIINLDNQDLIRLIGAINIYLDTVNNWRQSYQIEKLD